MLYVNIPRALCNRYRLK